MRRTRAEVPEIIRRAHQTLTKVMVPQAIDNHAREQFACAVLGICQPRTQCRQFRIARAPVGILLALQHANEPRPHRLLGRTPTPFAKHSRLINLQWNCLTFSLGRFLHLIPKHRGELIIFLGRHWIHRMIMAPRAAKTNTKESHSGGCHHVVQPMKLFIVRIRIILQPRTQMNELPQLLVFFFRHKMEPDKLIERHILIERADHRIAKAPGVRPRFVIVHRQLPTAFTKTHDIQPMPPPALAKRRLGQ